MDVTEGPTWLGPALRVDFMETDVDGYEETGGAGLSMRFRDRSARSLRGEVGATASHPFSVGWGVLSLQGTAAYIHEFEDDPRSVVGSFRGDLQSTGVPIFLEEPDRDFGRVAAAASAILKNGWVVFLQGETLVGHHYEWRNRFALGVRWER
jgi:outer membrane autotransporter protein